MRKINYTVNNTIISTVKLVEGTGDLDFEMYVDILGEKKVDAAYEDDGIHCINVDDLREYDTHPVKIEELKKFIEKAKKSGCNYIAINYNCDHPDYRFFGVDIHAASKPEIKKIKDKEKQETLSRAEKLRIQAAKLIEEAERLSK